MGYLQNDNKSEQFGADLLTGLKKFQSHYGLNDDGVAGSNTLQSINVEPETRLAQVAVNLERIRWLNFEKGSTFILVNQPNFRAIFKNNGRIIWDSRVVIGLPDFQTAEFIDEMTHIIVNPTWHVPKSIAVDEYLPLIQENPNFIIENNMRLMIRGTDKEIDPTLIDMSLFTVNNFPFEIKQNPSNINALGLVKFMFPNKYSIYMHDTPTKDLFSKDLRAFSHGCVRVQTPFEFANALLSGEKETEVEQFSKALSSNIETQINLVNGVPVYLTYRTVFFTEEGIPQYRPDIYGRDALLYLELFKAGLSPEIQT
jgi:murein L,D-transpeptidase YcbB/YkuD